MKSGQNKDTIVHYPTTSCDYSYWGARCYFQVGFVPSKTKDSAFKASLSDSSLMCDSYTMMGGHTPRTYSPSADALYQAPNVCH